MTVTNSSLASGKTEAGAVGEQAHHALSRFLVGGTSHGINVALAVNRPPRIGHSRVRVPESPHIGAYPRLSAIPRALRPRSHPGGRRFESTSAGGHRPASTCIALWPALRPNLFRHRLGRQSIGTHSDRLSISLRIMAPKSSRRDRFRVSRLALVASALLVLSVFAAWSVASSSASSSKGFIA
jgi:hypothetical protein